MVGRHTSLGIEPATFKRKTGGMAVDGLAGRTGSGQLCHHLAVAMQHSHEVHHLGQESNVIALHQGCDLLTADRRAAGLHVAAYRRHAAGRTEQEVELRLAPQVNHHVNPFNAHHVCNLVRVGNGPDGAVFRRHTGKLRGQHHTALDVYVAVDKSRHQVRPRLHAVR